MKRRGFLHTLAFTPAAATLLHGQQSAPAADAPLAMTAPEQAAEPVLRFFNSAQSAALRRLGDLIMPKATTSAGMTPSASECGAAPFLDFLLSVSPSDRQQLYRAGLDGLNSESRKRFGKTFAEASDAQCEELLKPLLQAWTYDPPSDPVHRFLIAAKIDLRTATMNSPEWNASGARGGAGLYWLPID